MRENMVAFLQSAMEVFGLEGPVYEFGISTSESPSQPGWGLGCPSGTESATCLAASRAAIDPLENPTRLPFADHAARTVLCIDTLGYVLQPHRTVGEMVRILAPGGILLVSCSVDPQVPDRAQRYWRPTASGVQALFAGLEATLVGWQGTDRFPHTLFGIGQKSPLSGEFVTGAGQFLDTFQRRLDETAVRTGRRRRWRRFLGGWLGGRLARLIRRDYHQARFILHLPVGEHFPHELLAKNPHQHNTGSRIDQLG